MEMVHTFTECGLLHLIDFYVFYYGFL